MKIIIEVKAPKYFEDHLIEAIFQEQREIDRWFGGQSRCNVSIEA